MPKVTMVEENPEIEPVEEVLPDPVDDDLEMIDPELDDKSVEDMNPDEVLWPDGPTAGQIIEWKEEFGDVYITSLTFDEHVVWRTINRGEYRAAMQHMEKLMANGNVSQSEALMENEEVITEMCLLYPKLTRKQFSGKKAGLPTILAQQILEASGFNPIDIRLM
jgi:hypothetical protein